MVTVMAWVGTASRSGKWPSLTCWRAAGRLELDHLDVERVVEVGHRRVVEGQVPVLADAEAAQVERVLPQQVGVAAALGLGVAETLDVVGGLRVGRLHDALADPALEAGRVVRSDPDVLVHVEDDGVGPGHPVGLVRPGRATKASWELPVANMACAVPRAATAARITSARLVGRGPGHGGHVGVHVHGGAVDGPGPGLARRSACQARLGQTGPVRDVELPGPGPPGGGLEGGAPLPRRDAGGGRAPAGAVGVGQGRDRAAHRLVQGARRPGRRVGHARAGPRPRRRGLVGRQPRPGPGLRRVQARRHASPSWCRPAPRRPRCRPCSSSTSASSCTARATARPRPTPSSWPRARGAATCRPTTTPTSSPARRRWPGSWSSRCPSLGTVVVPCGGRRAAGGRHPRPRGDGRARGRGRVRGLALHEHRPGRGRHRAHRGRADRGRRAGGQPRARRGDRRRRARPRRRRPHRERGRHPLRHGLLGLTRWASSSKARVRSGWPRCGRAW